MSDRDRIDDMLIRGIDKVEEKLDKISDKIESLEKSTNTATIEHIAHEKISENLSKELKVHIVKDEEYQRDLNKNLAKLNGILHTNTESLIEHIAGVNTLKQLHLDNVTKIKNTNAIIEENKERIDKLEKPGIALSQLKKWLIGAGAIAAAIAAIAKFTGLF